MVGSFFWKIFPGLAAIAFAREILVKDLQSLEILVGEQLQGAPYTFENKILEAIYKLKNFLKNGQAETGIPPFDPYFLQYKDFDFILKDTALAGYLENVTFTGFSNFEPDSVQLKLLPLHFKLELRIDRFQIDGRYKVQGNILDTKVNATGEFSSETENLMLCLYLQLITANDSFQVKDFIFDFKTLNVKTNYTNEETSEKFQVLNEDVILFVLDQVQEQYIPPIFGVAKILLNHFLLDGTA